MPGGTLKFGQVVGNVNDPIVIVHVMLRPPSLAVGVDLVKQRKRKNDHPFAHAREHGRATFCTSAAIYARISEIFPIAVRVCGWAGVSVCLHVSVSLFCNASCDLFLVT